jgi:hypothetical protein
MAQANDHLSPGGRQIVEKVNGTQAAQEVAERKLAEHREGKVLTQEKQEPVEDLCTIKLVEWKNGSYVLTGNGLSIVRAEMTEEEKKQFTFKYDNDARGFTIPGAQAHAFQDLCKTKKVDATFAEKQDGAQW